MIRSKAIRDSARGEDCTLQISGVCNSNPETTVYAHLPDETGGIGLKSCDLSGCYACSDCHDLIDSRTKAANFKEIKDWYMRRAQTRTLRKLFDKGIITVKGAK